MSSYNQRVRMCPIVHSFRQVFTTWTQVTYISFLSWIFFCNIFHRFLFSDSLTIFGNSWKYFIINLVPLSIYLLCIIGGDIYSGRRFEILSRCTPSTLWSKSQACTRTSYRYFVWISMVSDICYQTSRCCALSFYVMHESESFYRYAHRYWLQNILRKRLVWLTPSYF